MTPIKLFSLRALLVVVAALLLLNSLAGASRLRLMPSVDLNVAAQLGDKPMLARTTANNMAASKTGQFYKYMHVFHC